MIIKSCITLLVCSLNVFYSYGQQKKKPREYKIQIALLLDASGSMDGLISQAKGQIWSMVNELSTVEKNNEKPVIEIALGTFGNTNFENNGYFKLHTRLTTDIDLISESLFELSTNGDQEYCGYAIQFALDNLDWSRSKEDLKVIFIVGNEKFNQGSVDYSKVCKKALKNNVIVNTIFCGKEHDGTTFLWEDGAKIAKGKYMFINHDSVIKYTETLWDKKIIGINNQYNKTFIPFGKDGDKNLMRQLKQDENALLLGNHFLRDRVIFKTSESYAISHWSLVDAYMLDSLILTKLIVSDFPANMQTMSVEKRIQYMEQKTKEREVYNEVIKVYCNKAQEFLRIATSDGNNTFTLDHTIINILKEQANKKGFIFKSPTN